jgi:phosphatidylglycerol:prolipoprotein diacylglycerol transferase
MLSTLLKIGPVTIHSYGLMIAIGFLVTLRLTQRDAERSGVDPQVIGTLALWGLVFGIVGARLLHILMYPEGYGWSDPVGWIAIWRGGLVFQGALPAGAVYIAYGCRRYKLPFWRIADLTMPYFALAHAFGRIGCFLNGCCYGVRTDLPWGIRFPRVPWDVSQPATGSPAYYDHCQRYSGLSMNTDHWSYPVHPTQLYGVAGLVALCLILLYLRKHWHPFDGVLMPIYLMFYGTGRFFVEFLRGDHNPMVFGFLSEQQLISVLYGAIGIVLFAFLFQRASAKGATAREAVGKTAPK